MNRTRHLSNAALVAVCMALTICSALSPHIPVHAKKPRSLRLTCTGPGFLTIQLPDGFQRYLKAGTFEADAAGTLVLKGPGYPLSPMATMPVDTVSSSFDGRLLKFKSVQGATAVYPLTLARFPHPEALRQRHGVFAVTMRSGPPVAGRPGDPGFGRVTLQTLD